MTNEKLHRADIIATVVILVGCTITVMFGDQSEQTFTVDQLIAYYTRIDVILYFVVVAIFVAVSVVALNRLEGEYQEAIAEDILLKNLASKSPGSPDDSGRENQEPGVQITTDPGGSAGSSRERSWSQQVFGLSDGRQRSQTFPPPWVTAEEIDEEAAKDPKNNFAPPVFMHNVLLMGATASTSNSAVPAAPAVADTKHSKPPAQGSGRFRSASNLVMSPSVGPKSSASPRLSTVLEDRKVNFGESFSSDIMSPVNMGASSQKEAASGHSLSLRDSQDSVGSLGSDCDEVELLPNKEHRATEQEEGDGNDEPQRSIKDFIHGGWLMVHAFLYAAVAGTVGAQSVLFGKTLAEFMKSPGDALTSIPLYLVLICMVCTLVMQLKFLNGGLVHHEALLVVPIYQTFWVMVSIIAGGIYFKEFQSFSALSGTMFVVGVLVALSGIFYLTNTKKNEAAAKEAEAANNHDGVEYNLAATKSPSTSVV